MSSSASGWPNSRLWAVLSWAATLAAVVDFAIYRFVSPQYEARSIVEVHPRPPILFSDASETPADREAMAQRTIETEIAAIRVDDILEEVVADPSVANQPSIKASAWPMALLRDRLEVHQIPRTELISVAFKSDVPVEVANIVNAVVRTYMDRARNSSDVGRHRHMRSLEDYLARIGLEIKMLQGKSPGSEAEMDAELNRVLAARLLPLMIEQAETNDIEKKAELTEKIKRLRGLARREADALRFLDWKTQYESLRRDEEHVRRKLQNLEFASRDALGVELRQQAVIPKTPAEDPRWLYMGLATTVVLLTGLAIGLRLDLARPAATRESVNERDEPASEAGKGLS